jgi:hypothetical protein
VTDDTVFADPTEVKPLHTIEDGKDYTADLVGEGKKYADVPSLARARLEADNHIDRIEKENRGLRTELQKRLSMEELVTKLQSKPQEQPAPVDKVEGATQDDKQATSVITQAELTKLVNDLVEAKASANTQKENLTLVRNKLKESFGDNFVSRLGEIRQELGLTEELMDQMAKQTPQALLKLVGADAVKQEVPTSSMPKGSIDTSKVTMKNAQSVDGFKGQKHYQHLLKSDPKTFWQPKTQLEMHNMAMRDPERYAAN